MKKLSQHKAILFIVIAMFSLVLLAACGTKNDQTGSQGSGESTENDGTKQNPVVTITMENDKKVIVELYPDIAPNTVANFISLIEEGYYDGLIFHRVIPGFMIQGGDPNGNGMGGPGYSIKGEFNSNGFENNLIHERGVISMARSMAPDSAGSQFFIMVKDSPHLDGDYAAFGKVIEGIKVVDEIVAAERNAADKPLIEQRMKTVVVDTKGYDYPKPEVIHDIRSQK